VRKLVVLLGLVLLEAAAYGSVTVDGGLPATVSPGTYRYTYTTTLQSDVIQSGDFFIVYDFYGYKPGSMAAPSTVSWSLDATAMQGPTPAAAAPGTSSNLVWTYQGAAISAAAAPIVLGRFSADSSISYRGPLSFGGFSTFLDDPFTSSPEPGSMLLVAAGLSGLLYLKRRKRTS